MQKEFHDVVSIEEAKKRLASNLSSRPKKESVPLHRAVGRVLAEDVVAPIDVPPFDRAAMDGYALLASDTFYSEEEKPSVLKLVGYVLAGERKKIDIKAGECAGIATGAPVPKGANAVVMVEYTHKDKDKVKIYRPVAPGENIMAAGSDIMRGELILRTGTRLSPRETGVLAALGKTNVPVYKKPKVALISTGDEIVEPGKTLDYGKIYDVNARAIGDAVAENGGEADFLGIVEDKPEPLLRRLKEALKGDYDIILTSGGTSAGIGDLSYRVFDELGKPGVVVHGIAIKPGKPTIIAFARGKLIVGLPGYPTSAMIVFDVFVAPILRELAGLSKKTLRKIKAKAAMRLYSGKGRYEYMLVNLVKGHGDDYGAYPLLTGSGAITTLAEADGFIEIHANTEMVAEGSSLEVTLLSDTIKPADLVVIGSHCIGVDLILSLASNTTPLQAKVINVGSSGGLAAVRRGESDISGTHLIDEATGEYNLPFLKKHMVADKAYLVRGYDREQGFLIARGNPKGIKGIWDLLRSDVSFINRNPGSGTRVLLDLELAKLAKKKRNLNLIGKINGYEIEAKSHSAVAAAVAFEKADIGLAIKTVAAHYGLEFIPLREEKYDFAIPKGKIDKPAVKRFLEVLRSEEFSRTLEKTPGLKTNNETGRVIHSPA